MSVALESGLDVTALHNHFFYENPRVYFMHISGDGNLETFAQAIRKTQDKVKEPFPFVSEADQLDVRSRSARVSECWVPDDFLSCLGRIEGHDTLLNATSLHSSHFKSKLMIAHHISHSGRATKNSED